MLPSPSNRYWLQAWIGWATVRSGFSSQDLRGAEAGEKKSLVFSVKQSHSRDRGTLEDPYRGNRLEVSYRGWCCGGCGCGACCIGYPGKEVHGPALKALRSHLHKGTTVGRAQRAVHWAWRGVWGTSFLLLPLWGITSTHVIPNQCTAPTLCERGGLLMAWATADLHPCCSCCLPLRSVNVPSVDAECTDQQPSWSEALVLQYWSVQRQLVTVKVYLRAALCHKGAVICKIYLNSYPTAWPRGSESNFQHRPSALMTIVSPLRADRATCLRISGLGPQRRPVPVCDAASAVSPAYISLCVPSDTRSEPDEAEHKSRQISELLF